MSVREAIRAELDAQGVEGVRPFDVHAHTGSDIDGTTRNSGDHVRDLEAIDARSVVFPLCVAGRYEPENRRVIEECRQQPDRLVPFARLDPRISSADEATEALAAGARGFKLHPRSECFRLDHPGLDAIFRVAAEARAPVLIHAGVGVGSLGRPILTLAQRHRDCPIVLAHAAISDLSWLWEEVPAHPNLFFDTSWWNASDLIALFSLVPPGRILFGSDAPYMDLEAVLAITLRCARHVGLSSEAIALIVGEQLERLLAGEAALDAGPAPGPPQEGPSPTAGRVATAIATLAGARFGGGDSAPLLELTRLALGSGGAAIGDSGRLVFELLTDSALASADSQWGLALAFTLLLTPGVESAVTVG